MEKNERETHDFMNVESFSQLPFIRPAPHKEKAFRLFGKEFGGESTVTDESDFVETNPKDEPKEDDDGESSRKFECHYCCRNFPTSQALGGHQNAHKRERQHAKRAHLQSAMVHGGYPEAHVYSFMNYNRFGSAPSPHMTYHSWNSATSRNAYGTTANYNSRFYGGNIGSSYSYPQTPPITGSPLGLWRIPSAHNSPSFSQERSPNQLPLLANDEFRTPRIGSSSSQSRYVYGGKPSVKDNFSEFAHRQYGIIESSRHTYVWKKIRCVHSCSSQTYGAFNNLCLDIMLFLCVCARARERERESFRDFTNRNPSNFSEDFDFRPLIRQTRNQSARV